VYKLSAYQFREVIWITPTKQHSGDVRLWTQVDDDNCLIKMRHCIRAPKMKSYGALANSTFVVPNAVRLVWSRAIIYGPDY